MLNVGIFAVLFDPTFIATALSAFLAFATIVTLGLPLAERDGLGARLKSVAQRREELRARHHAALNAKRGALRVEPTSYMKNTLERFKLTSMLESENSKEKLAKAGYRGPAPMIAFMFFRFVMPPVVFLVTLFYLFVITHFNYPFMMKVSAAFAGALFGYYLPDLWVTNVKTRRQQSIMRAFPDALDLMLICVESGMSIESSFTKVAAEIGTQSAELAEELALTTAELSYLPDFPQLLRALAKSDGSIEKWVNEFWAAPKTKDSDIHHLMTLGMCATYDPDPTAPFGLRLPVDPHTCELIPER